MTATRPAVGRSLLPAAEVALAAVSVATVATLWRLFVGGAYFPPLALHAVAAHLVAAGCRRRGLSLAASGAITVAGAILVLSWVHLGDTTAYGIPTAETARQAGLRLDEAWQLFGDIRAPAPSLPGFLIAAGAAVWIGAWLADVAAFRLWTPFEALIPSGTLFMFAAFMGAAQGRERAAGLWIAACLVFILLHRTTRQQGSPAWLGSDPVQGTSWLLRVGGSFVVVTVLAAVLIGPRVPTAGAKPVYDLTDLDGEGSRTTVSPLVELKRRLLEQADVELFTVQVDDPAVRPYWRLTSLDIFDGDVWSSRGSFEEAGGGLPGIGDLPATTAALEQDYTITALAAIWLPAALEPRAIDARGTEVRWEAASSTLIVSTARADSDGVQYVVESSVPLFDPGALQSTAPPPEDIRARGLGLPAGFPASVTAEAQRVVSGAATPYAQALALQAYFRGGFRYTLEADADHSTTAIERFLFETRAGYCEQFAGSFAAMARAVGLPARVAVGFTPGTPDELIPGLFHVRGEHAHAWPEVWISGAGWVPFEPTPGRGSNTMQGYAQVDEQQDTPGPSTEPGGPVLGPPVTGPPAPVDPSATTTTTAPAPAPAGPGPAPQDERLPSWVPWTLLAVGLAVLLVVLVGAGIAGARWLRRTVRRRRAVSPEDKVRVAWAEAIDDVGVVGVAARRHETPSELAARMARAISDGSPRPLATLVARAEYSPDGAGEGDVEQADSLARAVRAAVERCTTTSERLRAAVDPRPPARRSRGPRPAGPRIQIGGA